MVFKKIYGKVVYGTAVTSAILAASSPGSALEKLAGTLDGFRQLAHNVYENPQGTAIASALAVGSVYTVLRGVPWIVKRIQREEREHYAKAQKS